MPLTNSLSVSKIMHPSLLDKLENSFFPATATIQVNTPTNNDGVLTDSWANVSGLVDLDCTIAPAIPTVEQRLADPAITVARETHVVVISGYYNSITTAHRAVVTTVGEEALTLDILAVEHDSQNKLTRLRAEAVTN